jgi:hypothetical protein
MKSVKAELLDSRAALDALTVETAVSVRPVEFAPQIASSNGERKKAVVEIGGKGRAKAGV